MRTKGGLAGWQTCYALAERRAPDDVWREELSWALREAAGVTFAAVHTCLPQRPRTLTNSAWPHDYQAVMETVRDRFLPKIEAVGEGAAFALANFGRVYAPLEVAGATELAQEMGGYLSAAEINGYIVLFLGEIDGNNDGVVVLGDSSSSQAMLERTGPALLGLAALAERANAERRARAIAAVGHPLSPREREIASMLASGLSNVNVGARLGISEQTVAVHARTIYRKLAVHTRVELANRLRLAD